MRHLSIFLGLSIMLAGCGSNQPENIPDKPETTVVVEGKTLKYEVQGMTCAGCEQSLEKACSTIPGIRQTRADSKNKLLTVIVDPEHEPSEDVMRKAIGGATEFSLVKRLPD